MAIACADFRRSATIAATMQPANRFKLERGRDYFVLRLGASSSGEASDFGEEVASLMLPLTLAANLAVDLFDGVFRSTHELGDFFSKELGPQIGKLNELAASLNKDAG